MVSNYHINVSDGEGHLFCACDTLTTEFAAKRAFTQILARFPPSEGFHVEVRHWRAGGHEVGWAKAAFKQAFLAAHLDSEDEEE